jgi:hypothetical protein
MEGISLDHDEQNPIKPKMRWFQYRLKSLFVLTSVVGCGSYWYDWRQHRPPFQDYEPEQYCAAFRRFADDLKTGNLNHAYESTSVQFKHRLSPSQFEALTRNYPTLADIEVFEAPGFMANLHGGKSNHQEFQWLDVDAVGLRNWMTAVQRIRGWDGRAIEVWVWVVMDDSIFYRRPPPPKVEEIQIRVLDPSQPGWDLPLKPSWEQK